MAERALNRRSVVIVGAGISGLATAYWLSKKGVNVKVLEKENRVGGVIQSESTNGYIFEYGPNSLLDISPRIGEMLADVGISAQVVKAYEQAIRRYVVRNGQLCEVPVHPIKLFQTPLFSWKAKVRILKEPFVDGRLDESEESVADFVRRRLGQEFLDYAIDPFVAGVYAGDAEHLSLQAAFPKLHQLEKEYGSLIKGAILGRKRRIQRQEVAKDRASMINFQGGMETLSKGLAKFLGERLQTRCFVQAITFKNGTFQLKLTGIHDSILSAPAVVLTTPTHVISDLIRLLHPATAQILDRVRYAPVAMVMMSFSKASIPNPVKGFGFLVPKVENRKILGTLWNSATFSGRAPEDQVLLTTFMGGMRQPELVELEEESLKRLVLNELAELMGIQNEPNVVRIRKWPRAIPQYAVGHLAIIKDLEEFETKFPGIFIGGNFRGGISVGDCIVSARKNAERIFRYLQQLSPVDNPKLSRQIETYKC
ncbi:MAG: protoporphyrinogen oxidase [bacterium]